MSDFRRALRTLARPRPFTAAIVTTLAIGSAPDPTFALRFE